MTVWDLIVELQHMPTDSEVEVHPSDGGFEYIEMVRKLDTGVNNGLVVIESDEEKG